MKKILALAAVAALSAGVSASAANPFSDVSTSDWAYQAVSQLSDQGIVEGYPDGTFKGERNITRYELAQIIARLMAKEDQLNAQQQATINKLATEYAEELSNLGVRVSNLEKKVGNISWSGDARMRYIKSYDVEGKSADGYDGRLRITAHADVNDKTYVEGRFKSEMDFKDTDTATTSVEELMVHHQFNDNVGLTLGRQDFVLGQTGFMYDDEFDGAILSLGGEKATLDVGYGKFYSRPEVAKDVFLARLHGNVSRVGYSAEYYEAKSTDTDVDKYKLLGGGLTIGLTDNVALKGDYYVNTELPKDPKSWTAGLGYDNLNEEKPGTFALNVLYNRVQAGAWMGVSTYDIAPGDLTLPIVGEGSEDVERVPSAEVKYWSVVGDVVLQKNVTLHGEYAFNVKDKAGKKFDNAYVLSLNYKF